MSQNKFDLILEKVEKMESRLEFIEQALIKEKEINLMENMRIGSREELERVKKDLNEEKVEIEKIEKVNIKRILEEPPMLSEQRLSEVWASLLKILRNQLSVPSFETWILPLEPITIGENRLLVKVSTEFTKGWLERRYLKSLEKTIQQLTDKEIELKLIVAE